MRQIIEFSVFLAGATALHLAVGFVAPDGTQMAAGAGGDAPVTLAAANMSLQDMIADWDRPVELAQQVAQPSPDAPEMAPALMPMPDTATLQRPAVQRPIAGGAPALPQIDKTPASKPKIAEQRPKLRPAPKPTAAPEAKPAPPKKTAAQKPKAQKSTQSVAPQKAAGAGGKKATGVAGSGAAPKAKAGNTKKLMASWGGQISKSIERRKRYPAGTRARGTVMLAISVHTRGAVVSVSVRGSSGVAQLDRAALAAVKSARIAAAPKGLAAGVHRFTIPMTFKP